MLVGIQFVRYAAPIPVLLQFAKYERNFTIGKPMPTPRRALCERAQWLQDKIGLAGALRAIETPAKRR